MQDGPSLEVVPGSHEEPTLRADASTVRVLDVRVGDVVVMDQRLTHRGYANASETSRVLRSVLGPRRADRVLVTVGFALAASNHSRDFVAGTRARQARVFYVTERLPGMVLDVVVTLALVGGWAMRRRHGARRHDSYRRADDEAKNAP